MKAILITAIVVLAAQAASANDFMSVPSAHSEYQNRQMIKAVKRASQGQAEPVAISRGGRVKDCGEGVPLRNSLGTACFPKRGHYTASQMRELHNVH